MGHEATTCLRIRTVFIACAFVVKPTPLKANGVREEAFAYL
jgi:hypothetical protein